MVYIFGGGKTPPSPTQSARAWEWIPLGQDIFLLYSTSAITATGSAVTEELNFKFPFKLIAIMLEHTVAAGTLGTDALTWSFNIAPRTGLTNNFPIVAYTSSATSQFYEIFGDDYIYPAGNYRFIQNTTNTDLINVSFIVQVRKP